MNLLDLFDAHVLRAPKAIACQGDSSTIDYAELSRRSRAAARALRAAGVAPGDTVGVFAHPSIDLVVAVWAILRTGASYLPLAVDYPAERLTYLVSDSAVRVVLTDARGADPAQRILPTGVRSVRLTELTEAENVSFDPVSAAATAYTIYTSGTTGRPKGVVVSHGAIVNQLRWLAAEFDLAADARVLLKTPIGFDAAQWELLANACGATVVIAPAGTHTSPEAILERVVRDAVTVLQCVPTMWAELAALPGIRAATSLRTVASGGEALPVTTAERLRAAVPGARAINLYGPTETTINATWFDFTAADLSGAVTVPIGHAVPGCTTAVVDEAGREIGPGRIGELLIGGVQLADGYRGRPDLTADRFVDAVLPDGRVERRYRTGDLVRPRPDGVLEFVGRNDEQVKIDGHRIETNEVRLWIESHHWVRAAAVVPWVSEGGETRLAGFLELDPDEAPLMDQDDAGPHHRSKATRTQVTAQLAGLGLRGITTEPEVPLPGAEPGPEQRRRVFARKTYRTFTGDPVRRTVIEALLRRLSEPPRPLRDPAAPTARTLGELLRWFGPFHSPDRLLPKYSYASPGALNATQIYLEVAGVPGIPPGIHYFHPARHALYRVADTARPGVRLHLVGLARVIESVYSTNVREVLHFEAGHMLGVLDDALAEKGWRARTLAPAPVPGVDEGVVTASVEVVPVGEAEPPIVPTVEPSSVEAVGEPVVEAWVQIHGEASDTPHGLYRYTGTGLEFVSADKVERRHVIAINQRSYDQSSFAVVLTTDPEAGWDGFTALGRTLAHLQQLGASRQLGFMSAGYASLTGRDLPSARRVDEILGQRRVSYFALAGRVSADQVSATGMAEDAVHMKGPEELLKDDLRAVLPPYMVPATIHVLDRIPLSQNGKQDRAALAALAAARNARRTRPHDPPVTDREIAVAAVWSRVLGYEPVYRGDDFFAQGGNSMSALRLVRALGDRFGRTIPVQTIFQSPTVAELASATERFGGGRRTSRLIRLAGTEGTATTVLWPGLGGYPMNLRTLARELAQHGRVVYGMQARGLNPGETPHDDLAALIDDDLRELREHALPQPFRIVGYSFGARVAAEVAQRLVAAGDDVEELVLIAPGSPVLPGLRDTGETRYDSAYFKRVLASVFSGSADPGYLGELEHITDRARFIDLIVAHETGFDREQVERLVTVVERTYRFRSAPTGVSQDILDHSLYLRARDDGPSFADIPVPPLRQRGIPVSNLPYHHYEIVTAGALDIAAAVLEQSMNRELV